MHETIGFIVLFALTVMLLPYYASFVAGLCSDAFFEAKFRYQQKFIKHLERPGVN